MQCTKLLNDPCLNIICYNYAYLFDVPAREQDPYEPESLFRQSKWFTRGWTLQELLALDKIVFFDHDWNMVGTKSSLEDLVAGITGIEFNHTETASIAQEMSWASRKETTRVEDRAYFLMGLFGVNMPPIYGEGDKAFLRLQSEIVKISNGQSIFAWADNNIDSSCEKGLFADSPLSFVDSGDVVRGTPEDLFPGPRSPYSVTNTGLEITLFLQEPAESVSYNSIFLALITCRRVTAPGTHLAVYPKDHAGRFSRTRCQELHSKEFDGSMVLPSKCLYFGVQPESVDDQVCE
jgi:hypothetical protein